MNARRNSLSEGALSVFISSLISPLSAVPEKSAAIAGGLIPDFYGV
jgi:hypothetical protein